MVVDCIQYRPHENCREVAIFVGDKDRWDPEACLEETDEAPFAVPTHKYGIAWAPPGAWIIKNRDGTFSVTLDDPLKEGED